ncbi:hypothetical protein D3C71_2082010 [compost metagenome]
MQNNDSVGPEWVDTNTLSVENSSPLVLHALEWLKNENNDNFEVKRLDNWTIKQ